MWPLGDAQSTGVGALDAAAMWATAIVTVLGVVANRWRRLRRLRQIAHRVDEFIDDWLGVPGRPGVEARPGVMERLDTIERMMGVVAHEVRPNGGASLRDAIHRVDCRTASMAGDDEPPCPADHDPEPGPDEPQQ